MPQTLDKVATRTFQTESVCDTAPPVLAASKLLGLVLKFRHYGDNWGTYGEKAVKPLACDQADQFISIFAFYKPTVKLHVYPTAGGDIAIDWKLDSKDFTAIFTGSDVRFLIDQKNADDIDEQEYQTVADLLYVLELYGFNL